MSLMGVNVWASSRCSLDLGTVWPATLLHWHFVFLWGFFSAGQQQREVAEDKMQVEKHLPWEQLWANSSSWERCYGQSSQTQLQLGVVSPVLVSCDNCRDSRPAAAQQHRDAEDGKHLASPTLPPSTFKRPSCQRLPQDVAPGP